MVENYLRSKSQIILRGNLSGNELKIVPIDTNYFMYLEYEKEVNEPVHVYFFTKSELIKHMDSVLPMLNSALSTDILERFYNYKS